MKTYFRTSLAAFAMIAASPALAGPDVWTVQYPQEPCQEIISQEYSSGGGNTSVQSVEILCKDAMGRYTGFVGTTRSLAGAIGFGRHTMPDRIDYEPYDGDTLRIRD